MTRLLPPVIARLQFCMVQKDYVVVDNWLAAREDYGLITT